MEDKITKIGTNGNFEVLDESEEKLIQNLRKLKPIARVCPFFVKKKRTLAEILLPILPMSEMVIEDGGENWALEPEIGTYRPPSFAEAMRRRASHPYGRTSYRSAES